MRFINLFNTYFRTFLHTMFSSHERLKKRTPDQGIGRQEFIEHLVEEFHTTTNIEAQEQVTANLANFAYDPINWKYLHETGAVQLFLQLLIVPNERLQLHGVAGLCNICLDPCAIEFITQAENFKQLSQLFLKTEHLEILINCITLFLQILKNEGNLNFKQLIATPAVLKRVVHWKQQTNDLRISNICTIFLEDFGTRIETVYLTSSTAQNATPINGAFPTTLQ